MKRLLMLAIGVSCVTAGVSLGEPAERPPLKEFIGINGHFQFKPELYSETCRLARNYHNMDWDVQKPGDPITVPNCVNKVNWDAHVYGKWASYGFEVDLCAQFGKFGEANSEYTKLWRGQDSWAYQYGHELARYFGPSGQHRLVTSIEIGNEPGSDFDDALYQKLFIQMAKGIRDADRQIKIVTATAQSGAADKYSKSLEDTFSSPKIKPLYDVINLHVYAIKPKKEGQSPWDRSYPEDPALSYLKVVDQAIAFRDRHAPDKEVWITEFGYDACTAEAMTKREGWAKKLNWQGVSDKQQAQYLVRSILCFAERDVDRAYLYYFNDSDQASVHAASGLTRHFQPKPSFWAIKHLYQTLGDYHFTKVSTKSEGELYVYEFTHDDDPTRGCWVVWSPTGEERELEITLQVLPGTLLRCERMALGEGGPEKVDCHSTSDGKLKLTLSESPTYLMYKKVK